MLRIHAQFNVVSQSNKCFEQKYWLLDGINIMTLFKSGTERKPPSWWNECFRRSSQSPVRMWRRVFSSFAFESWLTDKDPFISQSKHFANISYTCFKSLAALGFMELTKSGVRGRQKSVWLRIEIYRINCVAIVPKWYQQCNIEMLFPECVSVGSVCQHTSL